MKAISIILLALALNLSAQDPLLINTQQSLIHLNPSFAGSNGLFRHQSFYRNQWPALSGSYVTYYNSFDTYIKPIRGGIALAYMRDDQARGTLITDKLDLSYAQHLSFLDQNLKIIPSVQLSYFQKTLDNTKLTFGNQINPRGGSVWSNGFTPYARRSNVDLSAGLMVNYRHLYVGGSVFHITRPDEGLMGPSKLPVRLSLFTSYNWFIGEQVLLNGMYRFEQQQNFHSHSISINALLFKHLLVGSGFRLNNQANIMVGYRHHYFSVSGSYEPGIGRVSSGSYELAASFNLRPKESRKETGDFERW